MKTRIFFALCSMSLFVSCGLKLPPDEPPPIEPPPEPKPCTTTLAWDVPSDDELRNISGYRFYSGEATADYADVTDLTVVHEHTLTGLECGKTYFVAVTAFNSLYESEFSNEVQFVATGVESAPQVMKLRIVP